MWTDHGHLRAGGKRLECACHGPAPGDAPTLVMLHEGLGCTALWREVPARLAQATGWGVCVFSRQGYGASDPADLPRPVDYMTREAVEVLPEVLDAVGFRDGALLGHSDGASIAAIHAGRVGDARVRGVGLIAPHFFTEPGGLAAIEAAREAYAGGNLRARLAKYHGDVDNAFRGWNDAWLNPDFHDWNIEDVLDSIRVPVLAVQGDADPYGTLAQIDVIEARCPAPVTRLIVPGCGHAPHLEVGTEVLPAIVRFLCGLTRTPYGQAGTGPTRERPTRQKRH